MSKNYDNEEKEEKEKKSSYHLCSEIIDDFSLESAEQPCQCLFELLKWTRNNGSQMNMKAV